jgi:RsiW-degrading membrane proteinase PrsW (M82 family)
VVSAHLLSTLMPHLQSRHTHLFRWGLLAGLAAVVVLAATGLVAAAVVVAALVVPLLYIAYLRHLDSFAGEPLTVLAATVGFGAVVGVAVTLTAGAIGNGLSGGGVLVLGAVTATIAALVVPAGPLSLLRRRYPHTVDGLVLGVAAGAGFAIAQTLVNLAGVIGNGSFHVDPSNWVFTLFSAALLIPLLHGSCSGLVSASLWHRRGGHDAGLRALGLPLAVVADISFTVGSELLDDAGLTPFFVLLWQATVVAGVVIAIRVLVHAATLDEATELGLRERICHHCGRRVEAAGFCPQCGVSLRTVTVAETLPVQRKDA